MMREREELINVQYEILLKSAEHFQRHSTQLTELMPDIEMDHQIKEQSEAALHHPVFIVMGDCYFCLDLVLSLNRCPL